MEKETDELKQEYMNLKVENHELKEKLEKKGIPNFETLRKLDLSKYIKERDGADYINWAVLKQILHDNGAERVYFEPIANDNGSSLITADIEFKDKNDIVNRVYETRIKVVIDDLVFEVQGPVMNGANPVKDNSMSQQRLWNSQTRLFVKGVAIHTGLGFDLWSRLESVEEEENTEENLYKHNIFKIKERLQEVYTNKLKLGLTVKDIADKLHKTEEEVRVLFTYFDILNNFERDLSNIQK